MLSPLPWAFQIRGFALGSASGRHWGGNGGWEKGEVRALLSITLILVVALPVTASLWRIQALSEGSSSMAAALPATVLATSQWVALSPTF